jgi:hypothetical protein
MKLNSLKPQLKPKALEGGITEFYVNLKKQYHDNRDITYIKGTPCALGCVSIIRKLIKILSMQPGALSNNKPKIFAPIPLNIAVLDPIVNKENLDWKVKVKNVKTDMNATHAVSLYNINRKLSHLIAYDLNLDEKALENYLKYINAELEFFDNIIGRLGGENSMGILSLNDTPSSFIVNINEKRRDQVRKAFNMPLHLENENNPNLSDKNPNLPDE